jgi:hypothetical protein
MDLREEPAVVTLPAIERDRYYSLQLVDLYTNNVDYLGTRQDGNGGGDFLIAGPDWEGTKAAGIKRAVQVSTSLMFSQFRTQLFSAEDIDKVKQIQSGYQGHLSARIYVGNDRRLLQRSTTRRSIVTLSIRSSGRTPTFFSNSVQHSLLRLLFVQRSPG